MVIPAGKEIEIERLLATGQYSQRQVAELTGVSRGTVGAIARGERTNYARLLRERLKEAETPYRIGIYQRCPCCGGKAELSDRTGRCRACDLRAATGAKAKRLPDRPEVEVPSEPEFEDDGQRVRYEALRRRKEAKGEDPPGA